MPSDDGVRELLAGFYSHDETARALNKHKRTLDRWDAQGIGPPVTYIGRSKFYNVQSLKRWIAGREQDPAASEPVRRGRPRKVPANTRLTRTATPPLASRSRE